MKALVKADFFDLTTSSTRKAGEVFEATAARIAAINEAFPGYVEKVAAKKTNPK